VADSGGLAERAGNEQGGKKESHVDRGADEWSDLENMMDGGVSLIYRRSDGLDFGGMPCEHLFVPKNSTLKPHAIANHCRQVEIKPSHAAFDVQAFLI
jgi:hypothetical protein